MITRRTFFKNALILGGAYLLANNGGVASAIETAAKVAEKKPSASDPLAQIQEWLDPAKNIHFHGKTSPEFHREVLESLDSIPAYQREIMERSGDTLHFGLTMEKTLPGHMTRDPTDDRTLPNHDGARCFYGSTFLGMKKILGVRLGARQIGVAEYVLEVLPKKDQTKEKVPTLAGINNGEWKDVKNLVGPTLRHEAGHALNSWAEEKTGQYLSDSEEFISAYNADVEGLGGREGATAKGYGYEANPKKDTQRCRDEALAEVTAQAWGGSYVNSKGKNIEKDWPHCFAYAKKTSQEFDAAHKLGGYEGLLNYVNNLSDPARPSSLMAQNQALHLSQ